MSSAQPLRPSLDTWEVVDGAFWEDHCKRCERVYVMGVLQIGDEKSGWGVKGVGLHATLRPRLNRGRKSKAGG
jgi:hypothetical protein